MGPGDEEDSGAGGAEASADAADRLAAVPLASLDLSRRVRSVSVALAGARQISPQTILGRCSVFRNCQTVQEAVEAAARLSRELSQTGVFAAPVAVAVDVDDAKADGLVVRIHVPEKQKQFSLGSTVNQRGEGALEASFQKFYALGGLNCVSAELSVSGTKAHEFNARLTIPSFLSWRKRRWNAFGTVYSHLIDATAAASHASRNKGVQFGLADANEGRHIISCNVCVRDTEVLRDGLTQRSTASAALLAEPLHAAKAAVKYEFAGRLAGGRGTRLPAGPAGAAGAAGSAGSAGGSGSAGSAGGSFLGFSAEAAVLSEGRAHLRADAHAAWRRALRGGWGYEAAAHAGFLWAACRRPVFQDRFHLGGASGVAPVYGVGHQGTGPVAPRPIGLTSSSPAQGAGNELPRQVADLVDHLGGNALLSVNFSVAKRLGGAGAAVSAPAVPSPTLQPELMAFVCGGLLGDIGLPPAWPAVYNQFSPIATAGVGLRLPLSETNAVTLTFGKPLIAAPTDRLSLCQHPPVSGALSATIGAMGAGSDGAESFGGGKAAKPTDGEGIPPAPGCVAAGVKLGELAARQAACPPLAQSDLRSTSTTATVDTGGGGGDEDGGAAKAGCQPACRPVPSEQELFLDRLLRDYSPPGAYVELVVRDEAEIIASLGRTAQGILAAPSSTSGWESHYAFVQFVCYFCTVITPGSEGPPAGTLDTAASQPVGTPEMAASPGLHPGPAVATAESLGQGAAVTDFCGRAEGGRIDAEGPTGGAAAAVAGAPAAGGCAVSVAAASDSAVQRAEEASGDLRQVAAAAAAAALSLRSVLARAGVHACAALALAYGKQHPGVVDAVLPTLLRVAAYPDKKFLSSEATTCLRILTRRDWGGPGPVLRMLALVHGYVAPLEARGGGAGPAADCVDALVGRLVDARALRPDSCQQFVLPLLALLLHNRSLHSRQTAKKLLAALDGYFDGASAAAAGHVKPEPFRSILSKFAARSRAAGAALLEANAVAGARPRAAVRAAELRPGGAPGVSARFSHPRLRTAAAGAAAAGSVPAGSRTARRCGGPRQAPLSPFSHATAAFATPTSSAERGAEPPPAPAATATAGAPPAPPAAAASLFNSCPRAGRVPGSGGGGGRVGGRQFAAAAGAAAVYGPGAAAFGSGSGPRATATPHGSSGRRAPPRRPAPSAERLRGTPTARAARTPAAAAPPLLLKHCSRSAEAAPPPAGKPSSARGAAGGGRPGPRCRSSSSCATVRAVLAPLPRVEGLARFDRATRSATAHSLGRGAGSGAATPAPAGARAGKPAAPTAAAAPIAAAAAATPAAAASARALRKGYSAEHARRGVPANSGEPLQPATTRARAHPPLLSFGRMP